MDRKELFSKIEYYDSEVDIEGTEGGDYGHRLADAFINKYGMKALAHPEITTKKENVSHRSSKICSVDPKEREMLEKIWDWSNRVLQNQ
jgi:hypothetical protein